MPNDATPEARPDGRLWTDELESAAADHLFAEPRQARAFALAVLASRQGCFTWPQWTQAFGRELQRTPEAGYFDCCPVVEALQCT